jgi:hypothetical protein
MTNYKLVNPFIDGNINTRVKENSPLKAAGKIYEDVLAPLFLTSAPEMNYTIEGGGKFYHFTVKESVKGDDAKFKISEFNGKINDKNLSKRISELEEQSGGKSKHKHRRKDDDDSSSSSDSPSYYSIKKYCYSPYIYEPYPNYYSPVFHPQYFSNNSVVYYYNIGTPILLANGMIGYI